MPQTISVVIDNESDGDVVHLVASILRAGNSFSRQIRDFAATVDANQMPSGLKFQPQPGQILMCHFGLGFQTPEIVKTRPVLVVSRKQGTNNGLCTVLPISSKRPKRQMPYHLLLPKGLMPLNKYEEAWVKGDLVQTVGMARLDRLKVGQRSYEAPLVPRAVLREARRCILHTIGMASLTDHW